MRSNYVCAYSNFEIDIQFKYGVVFSFIVFALFQSNMPKQSRRRALTGNRRREPMHSLQSEYRRVRGLNCNDVSLALALELKIGEALTTGHCFTTQMMACLHLSVATRNPDIRRESFRRLSLLDAANTILILPFTRLLLM